MRRFGLFASLLVLFISCRSYKTLNVYIENGSVSQKTIPVEIYLDGKIVKQVNVTRGGQVNSSKHVNIVLPNTDIAKLTFKIPMTKWETECTVNKNKLSATTWMHVALAETQFKKGYDYVGRILDKDTIIESNFYCELVDLPVCGHIEE